MVAWSRVNGHRTIAVALDPHPCQKTRHRGCKPRDVLAPDGASRRTLIGRNADSDRVPRRPRDSEGTKARGRRGGYSPHTTKAPPLGKNRRHVPIYYLAKPLPRERAWKD